MENASKALLMAGSILLAIIIISMLVISYGKITEMQQAKVDAENSEEITNFNKPFISYQKKAMYGTDIISVLNLAINNNIKYNVEKGEEYYVNITFKLSKEIVDTVYPYVLNEDTGIYEKGIPYESKPGDTSYLEANKEYSIENDFNQINSFLQYANNSDIIKEIINKKNNIIIKYNERYTGISIFKRYIFKCTKVKYDENGRVKLMKFEQDVK